MEVSLYNILVVLFSPNIVAASVLFEVKLPKLFPMLNVLTSLGIITVLRLIVKSKPAKLCGLAVLYQPLFNPAPKLSAIGLK